MILVMMMTMVITISAKSDPRPPHRATKNHSTVVVVKHKTDKHRGHGPCACYKKISDKKYKNAKSWRKAVEKHNKKCKCRCHRMGRPVHRR